MNIAIDAYHAQRPYGGIARYVRGLVDALARLNEEDRYILFANRFRESEKLWQPDMTNITTCEARIPRHLLQTSWDHAHWPPVEKWTGEIDVFHATHFVLPVVRGAKTLLTVHDLTWLRHPELFSDQRLNSRGYSKELPRALERADTIVAVSASTKQDLMDLMGVDGHRIQVVHEGVEPHFFVADGALEISEARTRYDLDRPYMLFLVGTPEPRKNLKRTLAAVREANVDLELALVGPKESLHVLLGGDVKGVHLLGSVTDHDLPLLLAGAEIALYPSLYEGFGLPLLEAMAAGTAVITSNISACPEVIGEAGICVDPYDVSAIAGAIIQLVNDTDLRYSLGAAGRIRASEMTWRNAAKQMNFIYHAL